MLVPALDEHKEANLIASMKQKNRSCRTEKTCVCVRIVLFRHGHPRALHACCVYFAGKKCHNIRLARQTLCHFWLFFILISTILSLDAFIFDACFYFVIFAAWPKQCFSLTIELTPKFNVSVKTNEKLLALCGYDIFVKYVMVSFYSCIW